MLQEVKGRFLVSLLVLGWFFGVMEGPCALLLADDFGTWNGIYIRMLNTEHVDLVTLSHARLYDESSELHQYFISQRLVYDAHPNLQTGVNYTHLSIRSDNQFDFTGQHRMELVLTPRWDATEKLKLELRNWLELRWIDRLPGPRLRSRHRLGMRYKLSGMGRLTALYAHNEFFFDYHAHQWNQNRFVPIGLRFRLTDKTGLSVHYMMQSNLRSHQWKNTHLLGTTISILF